MPACAGTQTSMCGRVGVREGLVDVNDQTQMRSIDLHLTSPFQGEDIERFAPNGTILDDAIRSDTSQDKQGAPAPARQDDGGKKLWWRLRDDQLGLSFRRQHPIGVYVVDFFAPSIGLAIELDGSQHGMEPHVAFDARRTEFLEARGLRVMRFWNNEVTSNLERVLETIWHACQSS